MSNSVFSEGFLFTHFSRLILSIIEILVSSLFSNKVLQLLSLDTNFCLQFIFSLLQIYYISCVSSVLSFLICWIICVQFSIYSILMCSIYFPYKGPKPNQTWIQDNSMNFETGFRKNIFLLLWGEKGLSFRSLTFNIGNRSLIHRKTLLAQVFWDVMAFL